jgi:hypothetical protein
MYNLLSCTERLTISKPTICIKYTELRNHKLFRSMLLQLIHTGLVVRHTEMNPISQKMPTPVILVYCIQRRLAIMFIS